MGTEQKIIVDRQVPLTPTAECPMQTYRNRALDIRVRFFASVST